MTRPAPAPPSLEGPEACPETDTLAQYAEGVLGARRRIALDGHLPGCDRCRSLLAGLARAGLVVEGAASGRGAPSRVRRWRWVPLAAAAAAALVAGLVFALRRDESPPPSTDAQLLALAERLAVARPDLFAGFRPLDAAERSPGTEDVQRGGIGHMSPAGLTVGTRPTFEWADVDGAAEYAVAVMDSLGTRVVSTKTTSTRLEPAQLPRGLERGSDYVWKVTAVGPATPAEGTRALHVASDAEARTYQEVVAAVAAAADGSLRDVATAQALLRRGFTADALPFARRFASANPSDPVGRDTLAWLRRTLASAAGPR
jgi:hypothetical protein